MRGFAFLASIICVACSGDGVFLEVSTERLAQPVDRIELVLAERLCVVDGEPCPRLQGPNFDGPMGAAGDIYTRGPARSTTELDERGVATFELEPRDGTLPLGIALARDVQGQIIGAAAMERKLDLAAGPVIYRASLDPITPSLLRPDGNAGAVEWRTGSDVCLGVLPLQPDRGGRPLFIVPELNPDCDAATPDNGAECDPLWYDGKSYVDDAHCAITSTVIPGQPCVLGHLVTCDETRPGQTLAECLETTLDPLSSNQAICMPSGVCAGCESAAADCQQSQLGTNSALEPRIDCPMPSVVSSTNHIDCSPSTFTMTPTSLPPTVQGCSSVRLLQTPEAAYHSGTDDRFVVSGSEIKIEDLEETTCTVRFRWTGAIPANQPTLRTIVEVVVDANATSRRLWLPIKFAASSTCDPNLTCTLLDDGADDSIRNCAP